MKIRTCCHTLLALGFITAAAARADDPSGATDPLEQRVRSIGEALAAVSQDIDANVESILDVIVPLTDSQETGNQVTQLKQDAIAGLRKAIEFYATERQKLEGDLARAAAPLSKPQMSDQVQTLDGVIDRRVDDILRISASLAENQDLDKYEYSYDPFSEIYNRRTTDAYKQNQKVQRRVVDTRQKLAVGLEKSIASLQDRLARYQRSRAYQTSEANRAAIDALIADTEARLATRRAQLAGLGDTGGAAGEKAITRDDFKVLSAWLNDQKAEVRASFDHMRRLKGEYDNALIRWNQDRRLRGLAPVAP